MVKLFAPMVVNIKWELKNMYEQENQNKVTQQYEPLVLRVFNLGGKFNIKWLKRWGIWRLFYFGLLAKFGVITVTLNDLIEDNTRNRISVGLTTPDQELWMDGYKVSMVGKVLDEVIFLYTKSA